jgi:outer membrane protein TolC
MKPISYSPALRRFGALLVSLLIVAPSFGRTLADIIAVADSTSPTLAEARYALAQARSEYTASRSLPNPTLFAEGQTLKDNGPSEREQSVGINQPLGFIWSQSFRASSKRLAYESALAAFEERRRENEIDLINSLSRYQALQQQIALIDTVLRTAQHVRDATLARLHQGDISDYQAQRIQAEMIELQQRRLSVIQAANDEARLFVESSGQPLDAAADVRSLDLPPPLINSEVEAVEYTLSHHNRLRERSASLRSAKKALTSSKLNQLPEFSIGLGRKTADPNLSGLVWSAELEIPLFGQRRSDRNLAAASVQREQSLSESVRRILERDARAAMQLWRAASSADSLASAFDQATANLALDRAARLYINGEISALEFVDAVRTSLDSFQAYLELKTARVAANLELRRATGLEIIVVDR